MQSYFNICWTCPVNKPDYSAGNIFWPNVNYHHIDAVLASSSCWWMVPFDAWTQLFRWSKIIFWSYQIFITTLLIHTSPNDFYPESSKNGCCVAVICLLTNTKHKISQLIISWEYIVADFGWDGVPPVSSNAVICPIFPVINLGLIFVLSSILLYPLSLGTIIMSNLVTDSR